MHHHLSKDKMLIIKLSHTTEGKTHLNFRDAKMLNVMEYTYVQTT